MTSEDSVSSNIGTAVLYENSRVRVWEMVLEPGGTSGLHRHQNDYLFIYVTPDNELDVHFPDRTVGTTRYEDGYVQYTELGSEPSPDMTHELVNVGPGRHRQILVEFLGPTAGGETTTTTSNGRSSVKT
jgi:hypothetical protein